MPPPDQLPLCAYCGSPLTYDEQPRLHLFECTTCPLAVVCSVKLPLDTAIKLLSSRGGLPAVALAGPEDAKVATREDVKNVYAEGLTVGIQIGKSMRAPVEPAPEPRDIDIDDGA